MRSRAGRSPKPAAAPAGNWTSRKTSGAKIVFVQKPSGRVPRSNVYGPCVSPLAEIHVDAAARAAATLPRCAGAAPRRLPSEKAAVHVRRPSGGTLEAASRDGASRSGAEVERQARESDARRQSPLDADFLGRDACGAAAAASCPRRGQTRPLRGRERGQDRGALRPGGARPRAASAGTACGTAAFGRFEWNTAGFVSITGVVAASSKARRGRHHARHYCRRRSQIPLRYSPSGQSSDTG